ncbi:MAG: M56 family metallopeptidase [Saprospiraceae bacterium]|nr:M56 family metallopeptidase [Saprospiraceae bacterium]
MAYLLEVAASWAVFYGVYHLLLRAETFHRTNRWYLLGTMLLGLIIPSLHFDLAASEAAPAYLLQPVTVGVQNLEAIVITASQREQGIDFQAIAWGVYWLGVVVSLMRFGFGLWQIGQLYRAGNIAPQQGYDLVATDAPHLPFSFFNNLFWSKNFVVTDEERRSIVRHEEAHIFQKHSHDVVLLELVAAFAWCVPFVYFYKKALKTTHEYLADAHVTAGFDKKQYGRLLLRQSHPGMQVAISNSLFSSQLKKRIVMMTKTNSPQRAAWKYLAVLPALAVLLMAFSLENGPLPSPSELLENQPVKNISKSYSLPSAMAVEDTVPVEHRLHYVAEMAAQFPGDEGIPNAEGGYDYPNKNLMKFIFENLRYPKEALEKGIEGMVFVSFVVEKDGSITNPEIKRNALGGGCEEEVLRIVSLMPKWKPGMMDGKPVRSLYHLPIKFKLDTDPASASRAFEMGEVDEMPEMAGCETLPTDERKKCSEEKMFQAIFTNVKYPKEAREKGIEGTVFVKFVIQKDGSVANIETVKSVGFGCDEEVVRVVANMPKWVPAKKNGQPVTSSFTLPVKFKLDEGEKASKPSEEVTLEVFPNPAGSDGFDVRFKAPAGRLSILFYDANAMKEVNEKFFDVEKGQLNTYRIRPEWVFANGKTGMAAISLRDANGKVLATTKVIVQ